MQIIFKHTRADKTRTIELSARHLALAALIPLSLATAWVALKPATPQAPVPAVLVSSTPDTVQAPPVAAASAETAVAPVAAPDAAEAAVNALIAAGGVPATASDAVAHAAEAVRRENELRAELDLMARRVGDMQARLLQLDALGERLSDVAGVAPETFDFQHLPPRGGPLVTPEPMSLSDISRELDALHASLNERADYLSVIDARLSTQLTSRAMMPSAIPVHGDSYISSTYGPRVDPFTGRRAYHEGVDFSAPRGTPILAAAGGVVIDARFHRSYGYMVDIDHGNNFVTRYAHASRLLVKTGELVHRGQKIALVGSTGRSTAPHLHFEVRVAGQPADPKLFLSGEGGSLVATRK